MGNETGSGYTVLDLRVSETEKDIKEIRRDLREHISKNDDEHKEMRQSIIENNLTVREIDIKMAQMLVNSDEMKKTFKEATDSMKKDFKESTDEIKSDVKALGVKSDKEGGWRAVIYDIVKILLMIISFIVGGKIIF